MPDQWGRIIPEPGRGRQIDYPNARLLAAIALAGSARGWAQIHRAAMKNMTP